MTIIRNFGHILWVNIELLKVGWRDFLSVQFVVELNDLDIVNIICMPP